MGDGMRELVAHPDDTEACTPVLPLRIDLGWLARLRCMSEIVRPPARGLQRPRSAAAVSEGAGLPVGPSRARVSARAGDR
jgi:hypothetical protein